MTSEGAKIPMGESPAVLAKREYVKPSAWCPKYDIEYDALCDRDRPKEVIYKDICNAHIVLKNKYPVTPLVRSKFCVQFGMELNYKCEHLNRTGSFHERAALYALSALTEEQKRGGVYTASTGNWALALAYHGQCLNIPVTIIFPNNTLLEIIERCRDFGASVIIHGRDLADAKRHAYVTIAQNDKGIYINGYDHPHVIAASGIIGIEILNQMPKTDAIIIPVGGGGLIAGIAAAVKKIKPSILIYGVEPEKNCSFFKAMENEEPYQTQVAPSIAASLGVPCVGYNAFHTARSFIDKMILIDDDWITRAIYHLYEEEKMVLEGAGAISLSALLSMPNIVPELKEKTVVCILSGGNMDLFTLPRALERAMAIEGRIIKLTVTLEPEDMKTKAKVLRIVSAVGANLLNTYVEKAWILENDFNKIYLTLVCETRNLEQACTLKRVLNRLFPGICEFLEEPYSPIPVCPCFPKQIQFVP